MDLPGTKVPVAAYLRRIRLTAARVRPTRPTIALCRVPSGANTRISGLILIGRGIIRTISENWKKLWNCWFELPTQRIRQIWENDYLSSGFGLVIEVKVRPRQCQISLGNSHRYISCQFQPTGSTKIRFTSNLLPQMGAQEPLCQECNTTFRMG